MKKVVQKSGLWQTELTSDEIRQGKDEWKDSYYLPDVFTSSHTDKIYIHRPIPFGQQPRSGDFVWVRILEEKIDVGPSPATGKNLGVPDGYHRECLEISPHIVAQLAEVVPFDFRLLRDLRPEEEILIIREENRQEKIRAFRKFEKERRRKIRKLQKKGASQEQIKAVINQLPEGYVVACPFFEESFKDKPELMRKAMELVEMAPFPWLFYRWFQDRPPQPIIDRRIAERIVNYLV